MDNINQLENRLSYLKIMINSNYSNNLIGIYNERRSIKRKINIINLRKYKIGRLYNKEIKNDN